jgi:hypothetical protein
LQTDIVATGRAKLPELVGRQGGGQWFALEDPAEDGLAGEGALALDVFAAVGEEEAGLGSEK